MLVPELTGAVSAQAEIIQLTIYYADVVTTPACHVPHRSIAWWLTDLRYWLYIVAATHKHSLL